jgi:hypothetical protein
VCDEHCLGELGVLDPSLVIDADELHPYFVPAPVSEGGGEFPRDGFCLSAPTPWALSPEHLFDCCLAVHAAAFIVATPLPGERHWDLLPRALNSKGSLESGALVGMFLWQACIAGIQKAHLGNQAHGSGSGTSGAMVARSNECQGL